jgi:hypothetical protein
MDPDGARLPVCVNATRTERSEDSEAERSEDSEAVESEIGRAHV